MKKTIFFIFLLTILVLVGASCQKPKEETKDIDSIRQVVENYMKLTLSRVPGTQSDYDAAKKYLTDDLVVQFYGPGFVPESYCIQNIPTEVAIKSIKVFVGQATVKINARFGEEWQEKWEFILVKDKDAWKISEIKCL